LVLYCEVTKFRLHISHVNLIGIYLVSYLWQHKEFGETIESTIFETYVD
jgi:hypothetical protein